MRKFYQFLSVLFILLMTVIWGDFSIKANDTVRPEVRALWVDAFRDGAKTPGQIDQLIQDAVTANINTLIVQVRRRGDSYYNNSMEPRTEDPVLPPGFDALQYLIDKAHENKIEVHAWLNTLVAWNKTVLPIDPDHVWNLHGPKATGEENWISYYRTYNKTRKNWPEKLYSSYYLDPGHPDVLDYTADVYLHVVKNYEVDGIHLDYSRYSDLSWGYNPTSIARYNARYGTTGMPAPDDPQWAEWRREQTAGLVRKIYLKAIALKPHIKVSSAVITWGDGPVAEGDWKKSRAYTEVYQDWRGWLEEGIIDMVIPMNYFSERSPTQQIWYNRWIEWEKDHQYGRQIVIGPSISTQYIEQSLEQIRRAQTPSALGNYAAGVSLYAYGASHIYSNSDYNDRASSRTLPRKAYKYMPETNNWLFHLLSQEDSYLDPACNTRFFTQPVFPAPAVTPDMPWKSHPTDGYMMGTVVALNGESLDHLKVTIDGPESTKSNGQRIRREVYTDGNGWFGLAGLPPGEYQVWIDEKETAGQRVKNVQVQPGRVSEVKLEQFQKVE